MKSDLSKKCESVFEMISVEGVRPRLLLHACCAPCSSYVIEYLEPHFDLTLFFYNPN
ncbi:MAG: epoxyqueuosine reductase QueH, partial [Clostridia bacterium]|nr:epoxyqueuosine reductase QueH [Clostridia bacterium]